MQRAIYQSSIPAPTAEKHLEHLTRFQITCPDIIKCSRGASEDHSFIECTMCPIFKERQCTSCCCCCCAEFKCIRRGRRHRLRLGDSVTETRIKQAVLSSLRPHTEAIPWRQERAQGLAQGVVVRSLFVTRKYVQCY